MCSLRRESERKKLRNTNGKLKRHRVISKVSNEKRQEGKDSERQGKSNSHGLAVKHWETSTFVSPFQLQDFSSDQISNYFSRSLTISRDIAGWCVCQILIRKLRDYEKKKKGFITDPEIDTHQPWSSKENLWLNYLTPLMLQTYISQLQPQVRITWRWKSLSHAGLFATVWIYSLWNSPGQNNGVGSHSILQGIFPTQEPKQGLQHCRWVFYQLNYREALESSGQLKYMYLLTHP